MPVGTLTASLAARLLQIAPLLGLGASTGTGVGAGAAWTRTAGELAAAVAVAVRTSRSDADVWLAIVGFAATFPTLDEHAAARRALELADGDDAFAVLRALLDALDPVIRRSTTPDAVIEVVEGAVVIDADFSGRSDHNTGVQRVLRETVSRWNTGHELTLVCWNERGTGMRRLVGHEVDRVIDWAGYSALDGPGRVALQAAETDDDEARRHVLVVPVRSVVVEIEVAQVASAAPLAALAAVSGNVVAVVGHDAIPIVSAQSQDAGEIERFARFLTVVKNSSRVAGVSESAATEYRGFVDAVRAQGVPGPSVVAVPLAMNPPTAAAPGAVASGIVASGIVASAKVTEPSRSPGDGGDGPLILVVGSQEPRKNHSPIVFAAGRLAEHGVPFRLRFIGGGTAAGIARFDREIRAVQRLGARIEVLRGASDTVLLESYREARFTVFPSLHEGFGLPVAESLALGVPVITSDHGSLAEMAEGGGCLTVDARDDEAIRHAMEQLLTDDELYDRLKAEALGRAFRTWDDYAGDLWTQLVEPVQELLAAPTEAPQHPEPERLAGAAAAAPQLALASWFGAARADINAAGARERSIPRKVLKVGALARFFVARSREMGVGPASQAAWKVVKRQLVRG
ncbi:hypothetical protein B7R54_03780 [Subtercola boreus]|uniref:Glycosyl transferase family 1 domain-containing protein n=1 Tax=Subtercola boreus TaxID=120213 RepID=A0A3E0VGE5_9MICO|nr:hypothetical protein B7R54_03780 [Subtercola boreus]